MLYKTLPAYLTGLTTTTLVNNGPFTFSLSGPMTVYVIMSSQWGGFTVNLASWTLVESGKNYVGGYTNSVYSKAYTAGSHSFDTQGAFWLFAGTGSTSCTNCATGKFAAAGASSCTAK